MRSIGNISDPQGANLGVWGVASETRWAGLLPRSCYTLEITRHKPRCLCSQPRYSRVSCLGYLGEEQEVCQVEHLAEVLQTSTPRRYERSPQGCVRDEGSVISDSSLFFCKNCARFHIAVMQSSPCLQKKRPHTYNGDACGV